MSEAGKRNDPVKRTSLLVGAHFRPPAKALLAVLPSGARLTLRAEPTNPYDAGAIQVLVAPSEVPEGQLATLGALAQGQGFDLETIMAEPEWQLGYVAASTNKKAMSSGRWAGNLEWAEVVPCEARLGFDEEGNPTVAIGGDSNVSD